MVSRSVDAIADDYLSHHDTPGAAARSLARWQVAKCGTSGFLSGLGGIVTLPFLTKFGEKGAINLGKLVPIAGGLIGGGVDIASTIVISRNAIRMVSLINSHNRGSGCGETSLATLLRKPCTPSEHCHR